MSPGKKTTGQTRALIGRLARKWENRNPNDIVHTGTTLAIWRLFSGSKKARRPRRHIETKGFLFLPENTMPRLAVFCLLTKALHLWQMRKKRCLWTRCPFSVSFLAMNKQQFWISGPNLYKSKRSANTTVATLDNTPLDLAIQLLFGDKLLDAYSQDAARKT